MRNKTTIIAACAVCIVTIAVAALARDTNAGRAVQKEDATQTAKVELTDNGFEPVSLKLKADVPAKVTFTRHTDAGCAKEVVMKDYKIKRDLPLNESVVIEFTPRKGEFTFACAMGMLKGKLIVE
jgi:plastocyanin domain-containing protein